MMQIVQMKIESLSLFSGLDWHSRSISGQVEDVVHGSPVPGIVPVHRWQPKACYASAALAHQSSNSTAHRALIVAVGRLVSPPRWPGSLHMVPGTRHPSPHSYTYVVYSRPVEVKEKSYYLPHKGNR